jgi:hypothetical protein
LTGTAPPWTFGLEPLPQAVELAPLLRELTGLVLSLDADDGAAADLAEQLRVALAALRERVPPDPRPRLGLDAPASQRPYLDHSRHVGRFNAGFPEYEIAVTGDRASGTVTFPLAFEGPPGVVHGGVLATFFDCVIQHHNCDVGVAGKTTSLRLDYRRPTPVGTDLAFEIERTADDRRITSAARLVAGGDLCCTAAMEAVAGDRSRLPMIASRTGRP